MKARTSETARASATGLSRSTFKRTRASASCSLRRRTTRPTSIFRASFGCLCLKTRTSEFGLSACFANSARPSSSAATQSPVRSLAAFERSDHADDWRELMRLYMVRRTRSFIQDNYAATDPVQPTQVPDLRGRCAIVFSGPHSEDGKDPYQRERWVRPVRATVRARRRGGDQRTQPAPLWTRELRGSHAAQGTHASGGETPAGPVPCRKTGSWVSAVRTSSSGLRAVARRFSSRSTGTSSVTTCSCTPFGIPCPYRWAHRIQVSSTPPTTTRMSTTSQRRPNCLRTTPTMISL